MAFYPCKICGNPMDPIYSDGICDYCYFGQSSFFPLKNDKKSRASSRSACSGKKKKSKIQKAAALIMAMMIALSSLCLCSLTAGAEVVSGVFQADYTYMGYDVAEFNIDQRLSALSIKAIYDKYFPTFDVNNHLAMFLFEFDENGTPFFYCTYGRYGNPGGFTWDMSAVSETSHYLAMTSYSMIAEDMGVKYNYIDVRYNQTHTILCHQNVGTVSESGAPYSIDMVNGVHGAYSGSFVSDTRYLLFAPYNSNETDGNNILPTLLNGTREEDFQPNYLSKNFSAKFHSFASMNDNVGGLQGILNMIDWLGMGNQYPTCDFSINDNGNHHSYSLRISTNKNYVDICMSLWEDYRLNKIVQTGSTAIALSFTPDIISKFVLASTNGSIDVFGIRNNVDNITDAVRFAAQVNFLQSIEDLSYVTEYNLTNQHMRFNEGESSSRAYSVCLADYVSIVKGLVYKLEIIDNNTGIVLDKAYFCNDISFQKTNTGYGTKVYSYDDYNDLLDDIDKGNDYGSSSDMIESDKLQTDNNNDIIVNFDPTQLDLGSYMDSLNGIVSNVSSFFTWVWALFPPEIMTIIIMGVGLLITCGLIKFFVG